MGQLGDVRAPDLVFFVKKTNICAFLGTFMIIFGVGRRTVARRLFDVGYSLATYPQQVLVESGAVRRLFDVGYSLATYPHRCW